MSQVTLEVTKNKLTATYELPCNEVPAPKSTIYYGDGSGFMGEYKVDKITATFDHLGNPVLQVVGHKP